MAQQPIANGGLEVAYERQMLKRSLTLLPLFGRGEPEALAPDPFMELMPKYDFLWGVQEMKA